MFFFGHHNTLASSELLLGRKWNAAPNKILEMIAWTAKNLLARNAWNSYRPHCFANAMLSLILLFLLLQTTVVEAWSISTKSLGSNALGFGQHNRFLTYVTQKYISAPDLSINRLNPNHHKTHYIFHPHPLHSSSTEIEEVSASAPTSTSAVLSIEAHSGLSDEEFALLVESIQDAYAETTGLDGISCDTAPAPGSTGAGRGDDDGVLVGALRRVVSLRTNLDEVHAECLRALIAESVDHLIYGTGDLSQPVLVSVRGDAAIDAILETEIEEYGLRTPIHSGKDVPTTEDEANVYIPSFRIELDAAETQLEDSGKSFWDTSSVVVFDDLVGDDLRGRLLDVVNGKKSDSSNEWNDVENGPDPSRWMRGGLQDIPDNEEDDGSGSEDEAVSSWGLPVEAVEDICLGEHEAIQEFESILTNLFPQFVVSRLPEAVYGECVSPLTANAPVAGEEGLYDYHIDGDPLQTPPSPWTDVYGRYPNRAPGKPRFVSCLVYLNDEWDDSNWGAATKFYDPPTQESIEVAPRPGRCVIMDQDLGHTVTPPKAAAGNRPRYSLVWKLILHPKTENQDMTDFVGPTVSTSQWPEPELFGSAAVAH